MTLKVKVNNLHFQYQLRESHGANFVIAAQIHYKLSYGQADFLSQNGQIDLQVQGLSPPSSIPVESISVCIFGTNLVIAAELSHREIDLQVQGLSPPSSIPVESISVCIFGTNLVIAAEVIAQRSQISYNSESKWSKWPKWPWRWSMTSIFSTNQEYPRMHVWYTFGDFISNLWWVIVQTRKSWWTDGQTDRCRQRQYPFGLSDQGVKIKNQKKTDICRFTCHHSCEHQFLFHQVFHLFNT